MLVENKVDCMRSIGSIILYPGINEVNDKLWEEVQPLFGSGIDLAIKHGQLKIHGKEVSKKSTDGKTTTVIKPRKISDLKSEGQMKSLINKCNSLDSLEIWKDDEKTKPLIKVYIQKRIDKLNEEMKHVEKEKKEEVEINDDHINFD